MLVFSGECRAIGTKSPGSEEVQVFNLEAQSPSWNSDSIEFTTSVDGESTSYMVVASFNRPRAGNDHVGLQLGWKPNSGTGRTKFIYSESKGELGSTIYLRYEIKPGVRITCTGNVE
jgi:hypothetical protein